MNLSLWFSFLNFKLLYSFTFNKCIKIIIAKDTLLLISLKVLLHYEHFYLIFFAMFWSHSGILFCECLYKVWSRIQGLLLSMFIQGKGKLVKVPRQHVLVHLILSPDLSLWNLWPFPTSKWSWKINTSNQLRTSRQPWAQIKTLMRGLQALLQKLARCAQSEGNIVR